MVDGRRVRGGAAVDDGVGGEVGELGEGPYQGPGVWRGRRTPGSTHREGCTELSDISSINQTSIELLYFIQLFSFYILLY